MPQFALVVLYIGAVISALQGFGVSKVSVSAIHQTYGALWWIMFFICVAGIGILHAMLDVIGTLDGTKAKYAAAREARDREYAAAKAAREQEYAATRELRRQEAEQADRDAKGNS